MKNKTILALFLLSMTHQAYCQSFKDRLKEALEQAAQSAPPQGTLSSQEAASPTTVLVENNSDRDLMKQGMWRDPKTNLIWQRCALGQTWTGVQCSGMPEDLTWANTVMRVKSLSAFGHTDWRIPTIKEYEVVLRCPDDTLETSESAILGKTEDSCGSRQLTLNRDVFTNPALDSSDVSFWRMKNSRADSSSIFALGGYVYGSTEQNTLLVRGGQPTGQFEKAVELAKEELKQVQQQEALKKQEDADFARRQAEYEAKQAENRKLAIAHAELAKRDYQARTIDLRRNVKVGDRTQQGLVIAIKGPLVKVQQYGKHCLEYMDKTAGCFRSETVVTGEAWVNRNELLP